MSYVTIFKIEQNGDVVAYAEGSNNHTFAPLVWDVLGYKHGYMNKALHPYSLVDPGLNAMLKAWPDPKMPRLEQILLGSTLDFMWCKREHLPALIEACEWFLKEHVLKPHKSKNWKTGLMEEAFYDSRTLQGDPEEMLGPGGKMFRPHTRNLGIIRALKEIYEDQTSRGAAFNCCSAAGAFWYVRDVPFVGESEDGTVIHSKDSDCTIKEDECEVCGVWRSETACEKCGGHSFHKEDCSEYDWETRPWNIDKDHVQPSGEYQGKKAFDLFEVLGT